MKKLQTIYTPEQQAKIDAANKKSVAGVRKGFARNATTEQCLARLQASVDTLISAYYMHPAGPDYPRPVSEAMRQLKSEAALVRSAQSSFPSGSRSAVAVHG